MGLLKTAGKVAVASAVHGRVQRRQQRRWAAEDAAAGVPAVAPSQAAPGAPGAGVDSMLARLTQLGELKAAGVLTEAEFEVQKARILGG